MARDGTEAIPVNEAFPVNETAPGREALMTRAFVELADTLVEDYDVIEFLQLLAERCVQLLGVSEAGVVLFDVHGRLRPLASSSERMQLVELIEVQTDDGPCLDCCRDGRPVHEDDLEGASGRWPQFAAAALDAGFRSTYAVPMRLREERIGALNLFADRVNGLSRADQALGQAMADVATIGLLHERFLQERAVVSGQLQTALNSRISLEQAKGLIAEQADVDMSEAFDLLRSHARRHNRRLRDIVAAVISRDLSADQLRVAPRSSSATGM